MLPLEPSTLEIRTASHPSRDHRDKLDYYYCYYSFYYYCYYCYYYCCCYCLSVAGNMSACLPVA